jgi:hypothetical protein
MAILAFPTHSAAMAEYRVIQMDNGTFGVEVTDLKTMPMGISTISGFISEAQARGYIGARQKMDATNDNDCDKHTE